MLRTFAHELTHAATRALLDADPATLNESELEFRNRIETIYSELMVFMEDTSGKFTEAELKDMNLYGTTSIYEFVSEMFTNPDFRKFVDQAVNRTREGKLEKKSLWEKFIEALKNFLGLGTKEVRKIFSSKHEVDRLLELAQNLESFQNENLTFGEKMYAETAIDPNAKGKSKRMTLAENISQLYYQRIDELKYNRIHYDSDLDALERQIANTASERRVTEEKIASGNAEMVLYNFFKMAERRFRSIRKELDQGAELKLTHELKFFHKEINAYSPILQDIAAMIKDDTVLQELFTKEEKESLNEIIDTAVNSKEEIIDEYHRKIINLLTPYALPLVTKAWERKRSREILAENPSMNAAQRKEVLDREIPDYLEANREEINQSAQKKIESLLKHLPSDVHWIWRKTMPYHQSTDEIMQLAKLMLDKHSIDDTLTEYWALENEFLEIFREFKESQGNPNSMKEFYKQILEIDPKGTYTQYFVQEYRMGEFLAIKDKLYDSINEKLEAEAKIDEQIDKDFEAGKITREEGYKRKNRSGKFTDLEAGKLRKLFFKENYERRYTDEWYDSLDAVFGKSSPKLEAINQKIANILAVYSGENVDPDEVSVEFLKSLKVLYDQRQLEMGKLGVKQRRWLKSHVEFGQTDEYQNALIKKLNDKKNGRISEAEYDAWYEATHMIDPKTGKQGSRPLPMFQTFTPHSINKDPDTGLTWLETYTNKRYVEGKYTLKEKWKSDQYKELMALDPDDPTRKMYDFIMQKMEEYDKYRPAGRRLEGRLPGIRKQGWERIGEKEGVGSLLEITKDEIQRRKDDMEFGDPERLTRLDLESNLERFIPLHFTQTIDEKDQSYDIATMFLANAEMTMRFQNRIRIAPDLEALRDIVKARDVGTNLKRAGDNRTLAKAENNAAAAFEVMLKDRLYGVYREDTAGVKGWDTLQTYVSHLFLGLHGVASFQNLIYGVAVNTIEGMAGGYYNRKDITKAMREYSNDMIPMQDDATIIRDWTRGLTNARTNQLMVIMDTMKDFRGPRHIESENKKTKRVLKTSTMLAFHSGGEHFIQATNMYAMLNKIKIINENNEYIDKDGNVVSEKDAMTLSDAYQKNENGQVVINPNVKRIAVDRRRMNWDDDALAYVRRRVRHLNTTMHGNYGAQAKAEIERYISGRYLLQLRKWMLQGARRRWGMSPTKFKNLGKEGEDGEKGVAFWKRMGFLMSDLQTDISLADNELGDYFEGIFITWTRFHVKVLKDLAWSPLVMMGAQNRGSIVGNWRQLDDAQQANVKKAYFELIMTYLLTTAVVNLLAWGMDDDDDEDFADWMYDLSYYTSYRMRIELALYYDPTALLDIISSPFVAASAASSAFNFLGQLIYDTLGLVILRGPETYERGSRKGQWKLRKRFEDLVPGMRAVQSALHIKDKNAYQNLNR
jgi:hypothetical protein